MLLNRWVYMYALMDGSHSAAVEFTRGKAGQGRQDKRNPIAAI